MIQRIQSVYLALAAIFGLSDIFVPAWTFQSDKEVEKVTAWSVFSPLDASGGLRESTFWNDSPAHTIWFIMTVIVPIFLIAIIFLYQNRLRQIRFCQIAMIGVGVELVATMIDVMKGPHWLLGGATNQGTPFIGFGLSVLSLLLVWMASKGIQKDEKLVRSADRIR